VHRHNADRCAPPGTDRWGVSRKRWSSVSTPAHTVLVATGDWFTVAPGTSYRGNMILIPLVCRTGLSGVEVSASGPHVLDVGNRAAVFGSVAEFGDLSPGEKVFVPVRTDGAPGPLVVMVAVRAAGGAGRDLVVDVPAHGRLRVTEQAD
jgi:hypothetical protein